MRTRLACCFRRHAETIFGYVFRTGKKWRFSAVMTFTLQELATLSGAELIGDPKLQITGAASLGEATPGEISFFANRKYIGLLRKTCASAIFVPPDFAEPINAAQVRVSNPTKAFEQVLLKFAPSAVTFAPGIHSTAIVDPSVQLGERVSIQPLAVIEAGTRIGEDTRR
jgi:UDP-3-O-[3-hydroxymyristoyl] glucosamine N-acyltransferase